MPHWFGTSYGKQNIMGTMIVGDNIETYRLIALKSALQRCAKVRFTMTTSFSGSELIPWEKITQLTLEARQLTPTHMLRLASAVTGNNYKRGQHAQAALDVAALIEKRNAS